MNGERSEWLFNVPGNTVGGYHGFMSYLAGISAESSEAQITSAAHHEAGHVVIAAALGLRLRPEGIMVGQDAQGLACYCKEPDDADASVEANIIASFAGCYAENHFRGLYGSELRDYLTVMWSLDWKEARGIESRLSYEYLAGRNIPTVHDALEQRAQQLVVQNWSAIECLAQVLLSKEWESRKVFKSGTQWSEAAMAKYVLRDEIVTILARFGINAKCL
jgi:hypothetical protein